MRRFILLVGVCLLAGCYSDSDQSELSATMDIVVQNIGNRKIDWAVMTFNGSNKAVVGVLSPQKSAIMHNISTPESCKVLLKCEHQGVESVFRLDLGRGFLQELSVGHKVLYFQIDVGRDELLYKQFENEIPHDFMYSGKRLDTGIKVSSDPQK